jgi:hypothetical protein
MVLCFRFFYGATAEAGTLLLPLQKGFNGYANAKTLCE